MIADKVNIGCYKYTVEVSDKVLLLNNERCRGLIDYDRAIMSIADESYQAKQRQEQTWWHEVIHGIIHDRNIDLKDDEETVIDQLAKSLLALCKDNKFMLPGQTL